MNKTKIPYVTDTWNPFVGCSAYNSGCINCYAARLARANKIPWGLPIFHRERLEDPIKQKTPARIMLCSMSDLFHENASTSDILEIFNIMRQCPGHRFMIFTKRLSIAYDHFVIELQNHGQAMRHVMLVWSVSDWSTLDSDWKQFIDIPSHLHGISFEPLLSPICLPPQADRFLDWVVVGGETGSPNKVRFMPEHWAHNIMEQCSENSISFWFKQHGSASPLRSSNALRGAKHHELPQSMLLPSERTVSWLI